MWNRTFFETMVASKGRYNVVKFGTLSLIVCISMVVNVVCRYSSCSRGEFRMAVHARLSSIMSEDGPRNVSLVNGVNINLVRCPASMGSPSNAIKFRRSDPSAISLSALAAWNHDVASICMVG